MGSELTLLLDFGGTHSKIELWSQAARIWAAIRRGPPVIARGLEREIDPRAFLMFVIQIRDEVKRNFGDVNQIAITGQMASFLLVSAGGEPLTPIISWQDLRSAEISSNGLDSESHFSAASRMLQGSGYGAWDGIRPGLPLFYLSKIIQQGLDLSSAKLLSINQFAALAFDSELRVNELIMHASEAAATGLYDPLRNEWDPIALKVAKIPSEILLEVTPRIQPISRTQTKQSLVLTPVGDFQTAIHGAELGPADLFIHMATGGQVARLAKPNELRGFGGTWQIRPTAEPRGHIVARTHLPAGRLLTSITQIFEQLQILRPWAFLDELIHTKTAIEFQLEEEERLVFSLTQLSCGGIEVNEMLGAIVRGVVDYYVQQIRSFKIPETRRLFFSGGTLTKLPTIMTHISESFPDMETRLISSEDTSLVGLKCLLSSQNPHQNNIL